MIYEINCLDCIDCYIGQTTRSVKIRINEQKTNITLNIQNYSVVSEHKYLQNPNLDLHNI